MATSTYTSAADDAATIRSTLKREHGWTSRQVSVRAENFSLGSAVNVIVRDPAIPLPVVKAVAEDFERIRRCEVTGEILGGGNRYVSVKYSDEAQQIIGRRYADAVQRAVNQIEGASLIPVDGTDFLVGEPSNGVGAGGCITLWDAHGAGCLSRHWDVDSVALNIGILSVART